MDTEKLKRIIETMPEFSPLRKDERTIQVSVTFSADLTPDGMADLFHGLLALSQLVREEREKLWEHNRNN